jgi:hypothetical protein
MTSKEVQALLKEYLSLQRLFKVKADIVNEVTKSLDGIKSSWNACLGTSISSPPKEYLNAVERAADRLLKHNLEFDILHKRIIEAEEKIQEMIEVLPDDEQIIMIERIMRGKTLRYIGETYRYTDESLRKKFSRMYKKIAISQSGNTK